MYENMIVIDRRARESLQMQIRRQLAIAIVNRQFPLHEPLPSIRALASDLKVSVTTVALAYKALKADGFVVSRRRSGYFVNPDVLADPGHRAAADLQPTDTPQPSRVELRQAVPGPELRSRAGGQARRQPRTLPLSLRMRVDRPVALPRSAVARVRARRGGRGRSRQLRHGLLGDRRPDAGRAADPARAGQARDLRPARRGARYSGRPAGPSTSPSGSCRRRARRSASRTPATRTWSTWPGSRGSTSSGCPSTRRGWSCRSGSAGANAST